MALLEFRAPGVYVREEPSAVKPIAGVGTSTAGFLGVVPDNLAVPRRAFKGERVGVGETPPRTEFPLGRAILTANGAFRFYVNQKEAEGAQVTVDDDGTAVLKLATAPPKDAVVTGDFTEVAPVAGLAPAGEVRLCTTFSDFTRQFGDFSTDRDHQNLAQAVFGFFANGGTRCYVARETAAGAIQNSSLKRFAAVDEIAIVAAPGVTDAGVQAALVTHCRETEDRFAILDSAETIGTGDDPDLPLLDPSNTPNRLPQNSDRAAFYFPWIEVADPTAVLVPGRGDRIRVPPSGHMAGIYARVDATRGVHKAPANEPVFGALGLRYAISRAQQEGLNPQGVNVIRNINGAIRVWGARTLGGDANADLKYVSTRRLLLFLEESIDQGTQWVVFEPNDAGLWAKITRNVTAFLTNVWRAGALFGAAPQEAFFVRCDAETNPPEVREAGQVVTEVGVAIVKPAEFVVFRVSQWAGPAK